MSGTVSATTIAAVASAVVGVAGVAVSYNQGQSQKKAANQANQIAQQNAAQAQAQAQKQEKAADEANNLANMKRADTAAALDSAAQAGKAGASGTMLTGPQGIDPAALQLGKNTLLGA